MPILKTPGLKDILAECELVAQTDETLLITGERGTGKSQIATHIHEHSKRASKPIVTIDLASIPANTIDSELFGHEKGSFTSAHQKRIGLLESANGGTVFLDEIGELPYELQGKLLRLMQEQTFRRVGGNEEIHIDVRFITATNNDLARAMDNGAFRRDLFDRINDFPLHIPPLRERGQDILPLFEHCIMLKSDETEKPSKSLSPEAEIILQNHTWPGNIRQLEAIAKRAFVYSAGNDEISGDLIRTCIEKDKHIYPPATALGETFSTATTTQEQEHRDQIEILPIEDVLQACAALETHGELNAILQESRKRMIATAVIENKYQINPTAKSLKTERHKIQNAIKGELFDAPNISPPTVLSLFQSWKPELRQHDQIIESMLHHARNDLGNLEELSKAADLKMFQDALESTGGSPTEAAKKLRTTLKMVQRRSAILKDMQTPDNASTALSLTIN